MTTKTNILIVVGEPSGDEAAARVVRAASAAFEQPHFFGITGPALEAANVRSVAKIAPLSVLGLTGPIRNAGRIADTWVALRRAIEDTPPKLALLVDAPDFNLPLARILKRKNISVIYYIAPQVWAWRKSRLSLLKERVDTTALILPFEKALYDEIGADSHYVGHPLLDAPAPNRPTLYRLKSALNIGKRPLIAMLPGSRSAEWRRHGPPMIEAAKHLAKHNVSSLIAPLDESVRQTIPEPFRLPSDFSARDLVSISNGALVTSGTATLETALLGTPMTVIYRTDHTSYLAAKHLLKLPYISLPNWILGEPVIPELLQKAVSPEQMTDAALKLLDSNESNRQKQIFGKIRDRLGPPGVASRVAMLMAERCR